MKKLAEDLAQIAEINELIQDLQEIMDLFEQGNREGALDKLGAVQSGLENLREEGISNRGEVDQNLDQVLDHLEWIKKNADGCREEA